MGERKKLCWKDILLLHRDVNENCPLDIIIKKEEMSEEVSLKFLQSDGEKKISTRKE